MKKTMKYILLGAALAGTMLAAGCGDSSTAFGGGGEIGRASCRERV